jgi:hypothetical protein
VVDVAFYREKLTPQNVVVDIGAALEVLHKTLKPLAYQNLDTLPQFSGRLTTTEFLCRHIFEAMAGAARRGPWGQTARNSPRSKSPCTKPIWRAPPSRGRREPARVHCRTLPPVHFSAAAAGRAP